VVASSLEIRQPAWVVRAPHCRWDHRAWATAPRRLANSVDRASCSAAGPPRRPGVPRRRAHGATGLSGHQVAGVAGQRLPGDSQARWIGRVPHCRWSYCAGRVPCRRGPGPPFRWAAGSRAAAPTQPPGCRVTRWPGSPGRRLLGDSQTPWIVRAPRRRGGSLRRRSRSTEPFRWALGRRGHRSPGSRVTGSPGHRVTRLSGHQVYGDRPLGRWFPGNLQAPWVVWVLPCRWGHCAGRVPGRRQARRYRHRSHAVPAPRPSRWGDDARSGEQCYG